MTGRIALHVCVREGIGNEVPECHKDVGFDRRICIFVDRDTRSRVGNIDQTDTIVYSRIYDDVVDRRRNVDELISGMGFDIELSHFSPLTFLDYS
jgi:hypothetical protein